MTSITDTNYLHSWVAARQMALMGYVTSIIIIETGLTDKQLRRLYKGLREEGHIIQEKRKTRKVRTGATLLSNHTSKLHASILMQIYSSVGGDDIFTSISISSLDIAYRTYHKVLYEISPINPKIKSDSFSLSDAWSLANELRSNNAMFDTCKSCSCEYFTSIFQSTGIDCPFCYEPPNRSQKEVSEMLLEKTST
jgi:hypothetical protein